MRHYVLGFYYDSFTGRVLLIRKAKPDWIAGKLNGLGGSIEPGETPLQAMVREFNEESGIYTDFSQSWQAFAKVVGNDWDMVVFLLEGYITNIDLSWECGEGQLEIWSLDAIPQAEIDSTARALLLLIADSIKNHYTLEFPGTDCPKYQFANSGDHDRIAT